MGKKNGKFRIWIYAVVLFTSAFVVLLITAYSQIKFNNNINNYKRQINANEIEKNKFMLNYQTASQEIDRLNKENEDLKKKTADLENAAAKLQDENTSLKAAYESKLTAYEMLTFAEDEYEKGNIVNAAETLLRAVNINDLSTNGASRYNELKGKTFEDAALLLYKEGYNNYRNKEYSAAVKSFAKSLTFADDEYFSDDCYYFMAYSEYRMGNTSNARSYFNAVLEAYPDSNYARDAESMLESLN